MNIQTNERTYITDLRTKLKQQFIQEMHNANKDPDKGIIFDVMFDAYEAAKAEGKCFENPAQLQAAVGGRYVKAQIAFQILDSAQPNANRYNREVPQWFSSPLETALKLDIAALWQAVESDIASIVESRVKIAEHCSEQKRLQALQSSELVEELQDKLDELKELPGQLSELKIDNERLKTEVSVLENRASTLQASSDSSFALQRENAILEDNNAKLKSENQNMRKELERTAALLQETLIKKANLEGRLEERLEERGEFSKITNENTQVKS
ncbi:DNA repair protein [Vibrio diabolicus]|uniref:DNA repair protein n=1 Tax=Vibrio harveyi group TaxID=717610 RepID=UPI0021511C53|nr:MULTISPECIES: DNA repair protein [Vibrio harveyi group]MCE3218881.1 DNA repair protein [Vibrio diabolicus]MCR9380772.1 DNA repair protein [Vibrio alginolyticus]MCR9430324.1 DNA repair protein [Vibrio alginolyticus]MCR9434712.1 DNA repair protein [Vibrio alginolyticus]MDV5036589.1 DNA repair protein [Vibrio diabolicus]